MPSEKATPQVRHYEIEHNDGPEQSRVRINAHSVAVDNGTLKFYEEDPRRRFPRVVNAFPAGTWGPVHDLDVQIAGGDGKSRMAVFLRAIDAAFVDFASQLMQTMQESDEDIAPNELRGLWQDNIDDTLYDLHKKLEDDDGE